MMKLTITALGLLWLSAPVLAQQTQAGLSAAIDTRLASGQPGGISAAELRSTLHDMTTAIFQIQGAAGSTVVVPNLAVGTVDLQTTVPINGLWASGGGAVFQNCPLIGCLAGDHQQSALYLKATATRDASIAEYMVTFDCNLNAGLGGTPVGPNRFSDAKVCFFNSATTGANAGNATWAQAHDLVVGAADTGLFKINTELDITNNGPDCAVGGRNCYTLMLSGDFGANPITAFLAFAPTPTGGPKANAHYGILLNGANGLLADAVDIENSGAAPVGICNGCLIGARTHSIAGIQDKSTSPIGLWLSGTYATASIQLGDSGTICFEHTDAACLGFDGTLGAITSTFTTSAPFTQVGAIATISGAGTITVGATAIPCTSVRAGLRSNVSNGAATPGLGTAVGTTGAVWQPVVCNGTAWVYG